VAVPPSSLELQAGHILHGWPFRHHELIPRELTAATIGNSADPR
jgi:hypothetical protein